MRRTLAALVSAALVITMAACGSSSDSGDTSTADKTIYVLGPTPDHGWTAQAGTYAQQKVDDINKAGNYKAEYQASSDGEAQNDLVQNIIANGDAAGVVFFALDDSAKSGQEALIGADIPFISFDRIIEGPDKSAVLNFSGDNWAVGAGIGYWLQKNGMKPGDTLVTLIGDNGTVSSRRQEGFGQFLTGTLDYSDKETGETYKTAQTWTQADVDALSGKYKVVCNWSADAAYQYLEQTLPDIIKDAKARGGNLYVFSMDDEMTFGFMNLLEGNTLTDAAKADLEGMNVFISAIGGMQEFYDVMAGTAPQSPIAEKYFDGTMSMYFSPQMMTTAVDYMVQYLDAKDWPYKVGDGEYEPTFIVDKNNVSEHKGFTGH
ncbi:MAG TPA: substrate-binding domain-containing protein [Propionibacteriaceae bacterium]|nr:substrate-binding domain-containing protein [Propionibacteriaceae bacterium]